MVTALAFQADDPGSIPGRDTSENFVVFLLLESI